MQPTITETEIGTKKRFPWKELALVLVGGMGAFILASTVVSLLGLDEGQWSVIAIVACNLAFLGGSAWYMGVLRKVTTWEEIGISPFRLSWKWLFLALGISLAMMPLRGLAGLLASYLLEGGIDSLQNRADLIFGMDASFSWLEFGVRLIGVGILVPISEELYFRGMLHRLFQKSLGYWPRILLSSTIFALAHADSIGVVVSSFIMAIVIAIAYERTKSLWLPIAIHMTTNSVAVILIYVMLAVQNSPLMDSLSMVVR